MKRFLILIFLCTSVTVQSSHPHHHHQAHHVHVPHADESFRRLESGESSGESHSSHSQSTCCEREEDFQTLGHNEDGTQLRIDVGKCRQSCGPALRPLKREEFDTYLKKYPNADPIQIFLALQSRLSPPNSSLPSSLEVDDADTSSTSTSLLLSSTTSRNSCTHSSTCVPKTYRRERHYGLGGVMHEVDVVEDCGCLKPPENCGKAERLIRLHVDTPFETVVDVGKCVGQCEAGVSCRSVRNRTLSVRGPNGDKCVEVIEACDCVGGCYRVKEFFKVFDFSNVFQKNETLTMLNSSHLHNGDDDVMLDSNQIIDQLKQESEETLEKDPLTKVIDVGRCVGSCSSSVEATTSKCLVRSADGACLSSLYGGRGVCRPHKVTSHSYTDRKGGLHQVFSVLSCSCN